MSIASGRFVAFQDSDDEWDPTFLERLRPHVGPRRVVFSSHRLVHPNGKQTDILPPSYVANTYRALRRTNLASTQTVLLERSLASRYPFDVTLRRYQDWDLWLTMLADGIEFRHVPDALATLYRGADSISEGSTAVRDASLRTILRKHITLLWPDPYAVARLWARAYLRRRRISAAASPAGAPT